ncbi:hypothetical protein KQI84_04855 [bacterium]|nr:hypothetical protein [bacterium]
MIHSEREFGILCAQVNGALDAREVIDFVDYYPERANRVGKLWRAFCPVHRERIFRTLVVNPRRNTHHCEHQPCPAHQPGDLIDLVARAKKVSRKTAVVLLVDHFGAERLRLSDRQVDRLREMLDQENGVPPRPGVEDLPTEA